MTLPRITAQRADDLRQGLDDLRAELLPNFLPFILVVSWLWFIYGVIRGWRPGLHEVPLIIALATTYLVNALRREKYRLACWTLLLSMILINSIILYVHPLLIAMTLGMLVIVAANALLTPWEAASAMIIAWASAALALSLSMETMPNTDVLIVLSLYVLLFGGTWLAARPLQTSMAWALGGWDRAHKALDEVQRRRGELYRALRALEEATYRIERMNNELIVAQQDAEEARALKARFTSTVSHELRGPLNLVLGFSKLMALSPESYQEPLPRAYRADVDAIYRNTQHLVELVDDILDLSQIDVQRMPLVKDRIDLETEVIARVIDIVRPLAERKGLQLKEELAGDLPSVLADPVRLRQALLNLLTNAVRFTEQGYVTVKSTYLGEELLVSVQDTGPGIAEKDMARLFREFQQIHSVSAEQSKGSGLGLAISKHLIELHEGRIWAESTEGVGTTFYVTIPLSMKRMDDEVLLADQLPATPKRPSTALDSCLIVHDDPNIVRMLTRYLEDWRVVGLPNSSHVVELVEDIHPSAIVASVDKAQQIENVLAALPFDVPIISCDLPRTGEHLGLQNVLSYLVKPIIPEALLSVIRRVERNGETKILIVDDDPDAVRLLERMLLALPRPYKITKAYDGLQALECMNETLPDVVLMDLIMSGMNGQEAIERMRQDERLASIPVVVISARGWIDEKAMLGPRISLRCREPIEMSRGVACIKGLLAPFSAHYLPQESSVSYEAGSPDRSAFAARRSRLRPVPGLPDGGQSR
jgi:signal transduction histidine kinase/CheY-like chemotaxis protein